MKGWAPPATFDGYRLGHLLGEGGMGFVYIAHDTLLDRPVAVKFIAGGGDARERERFIVEARAVARIQHPNVVSEYRVGEVDGDPYLVSELIRGEGLDRIPTPAPAAWPGGASPRRPSPLAKPPCRTPPAAALPISPRAPC